MAWKKDVTKTYQREGISNQCAKIGLQEGESLTVFLGPFMSHHRKLKFCIWNGENHFGVILFLLTVYATICLVRRCFFTGQKSALCAHHKGGEPYALLQGTGHHDMVQLLSTPIAKQSDIV